MKTRFAPSPTGLLHLGNARTALFNALLAWKEGGTFLLRIEDTDPERSRRDYAEAILEDLRWLGLAWQEGPYFQSQRRAIYDEYLARLRERGWIYPCFCKPESLEASRRRQQAAGLPPRYPGTCAALPPGEAQRRLEAGERAAWRFRIPRGRMIAFEDLVRGPQRFAGDDLGDFVLVRADGTPAFLFSNALDDALMGITHVLRGEDHLSNTPRQLLILEALGLSPPRYGHLPLIQGPDGRPLSKRLGDLSLRHLRERGYLPLALCNYLARLGHADPDPHLKDLKALAEDFSLSRIGRAPARFDEGQLLHWQREALKALSPQAFWAWLGMEVPEGKREAFRQIMLEIIAFPGEGRAWARCLFEGECPMEEAACRAVREAGADFFRAALAAWNPDFKAFAAGLKAATGRKGKALFLPLRAALTGRTEGPELAQLFALMGERARERLRAAAEGTLC